MPRYAPSATGGPPGVRRSGMIPAGSVFSPLSLSPALWVDPSDASSVTISGSSGAYIGPNGLVCGVSGNYATVADSPAFTVTDEFEIIVKATPASWAQTATIVSSKSVTAAEAGYRVTLLSATGIYFSHSDGASHVDSLSSVNHSFTNGVAGWIKVTYKGSLGEVKFYTSTDGASYTQLGTTQSTAITAGWNSTLAPQIGQRIGGALPFTGTVNSVSWGTVIGGAKVFDADFESATPYVSAFTESALGAPVYVVSSTAASATADYSYVGPTGLVCSGVGVTAIAASSDTADRYEIAGDIDVIVKAAATDWTPASSKNLIGRSGSSAQSWYLNLLTSSGYLSLVWVDTAAAAQTASSTVATGLTDGSTKWVRATLDVNNGAGGCDVKFYLSDDGSTWTQLGATVTQAFTTDIRASVNDMRVGSRYTGTDNTWSGTIMRAIVKNGIDGTAVFDADFVTAANYAATFTETGTGAGTVTIDTTNTPANAAGALVSQINDLSGNARHLVQATAANMPKYWNGRNSLNGLVFDGISDCLSAVTAAADWAFLHDGVATYAVYVWFKPTATASRYMLGTNRYVGGTIGMGFIINYSAGSSGSYDYVSTTAGTTVVDMSSNTDLGAVSNWEMVGFQNDPANATANLRGVKRLNGVLSGAVNAATGTPTATAPYGTLFVGSDPIASFFYGGDIGEIVIFASPTAQQITDIEAYGIAKWAIV